MPDLGEDDVQEIALQLRELYPDDDDFEAAMGRLEAELAPPDEPDANV